MPYFMIEHTTISPYFRKLPQGSRYFDRIAQCDSINKSSIMVRHKIFRRRYLYKNIYYRIKSHPVLFDHFSVIIILMLSFLYQVKMVIIIMKVDSRISVFLGDQPVPDSWIKNRCIIV